MNPQETDRLLSSMIAYADGVSDLNFTVGRPPQAEVHGELKPVPFGNATGPLTPAQTESLALALMNGNDALVAELNKTGSCDAAYHLQDGQRFRINVFRVRGHYSIVLRALPTEIPNLDKLKVPEILGEIPKLKNGLVLVTGATGSGKSTTLAALVDRLNATRAVHIVTLEDPIEFSHPHKKGTVNQRELGVDYPSFADGLRAALRQAPKVILVGEMRDRETIEIALKAAETGHLVLSTLHTIDAGQTINRMVGVFNIDEQRHVRSRISQTLRYVVGQRLLPRKQGGRVAAVEVMGSSLRTRELIIQDESGDKTYYQVIRDAKSHGWQTFDQHIVELYSQDEITDEVAKSYCTDLSEVSRAIDQIRAGRGEDTSDLTDLRMDISHRLRGN